MYRFIWRSDQQRSKSRVSTSSAFEQRSELEDQKGPESCAVQVS